MLVFLGILKWIGIGLACLLGLLLIFLLVLLFWPFRYKFHIVKRDSFIAKAVVSFFFSVFRVTLSYSDGKPLLVVRLIGIPVYKTDFEDVIKLVKEGMEPPADAEDTDKTDASGITVSDRTDGDEPDAKSDSFATEEDLPLTDEEIEEKIQAITDETDAEKLTFKQKIAQFVDNIKQVILKLKKKCYNIYDSIQSFKKKMENIAKEIRYYYKVLNHPAIKPAWLKLLKQLKKIWRNVKPRKISVDVHYGANDPGQTASVYGYYCMIYPFFGKQIRFVPDLENEVFELDALVKGRVQLYRMLLSAWALVFDKNCRKVFRLLMREVKRRGK